MKDVRVECYSGYKWYGPEATYFRVAADDGNVYVLRHGLGDEGWTLEAFRRA